MKLLERYLATLGPLLPRRERADISQEIADEIESQMEEKASALKKASNRTGGSRRYPEAWPSCGSGRALRPASVSDRARALPVLLAHVKSQPSCRAHDLGGCNRGGCDGESGSSTRMGSAPVSDSGRPRYDLRGNHGTFRSRSMVTDVRAFEA